MLFSKHMIFNTPRIFAGSIRQNFQAAKLKIPNVLSTVRADFLSAPDIQNFQIPRLKVLDDMTAIVKKMPIDFSKTVIFAVQHHLGTTASLYLALQKIGVKQIYSIGKYYSTSLKVEGAMEEIGIKVFKSEHPRRPGYFNEVMHKGIQTAWLEMLHDIKQKDVETIIILDDGGRGLELMPMYVSLRYRVAGIEQTQAGLYSTLLKESGTPVVEVASSALKKMIEPSLIAAAAVDAIQKLTSTFNVEHAEYLGTIFTFSPEKVVGIVGFGAIGKALSEYFISKNFHVIVYDNSQSVLAAIKTAPNFQKVYKARSVEQLITRADIVFGCTGKDITAGISQKILDLVTLDKTFISVSSEDIEFRELLQFMMKQHEDSKFVLKPLADISFYARAGGIINIIGAGTPVNFLLNSKFKQTSCVPALDIAITRGILFGAIVQAQLIAFKGSRSSFSVQLDPEIQKAVIESWDTTHHGGIYPPFLLEQLKTKTDWIKQNSGGVSLSNPLLAKYFSRAHQSSHTPKISL